MLCCVTTYTTSSVNTWAKTLVEIALVLILQVRILYNMMRLACGEPVFCARCLLFFNLIPKRNGGDTYIVCNVTRNMCSSLPVQKHYKFRASAKLFVPVFLRIPIGNPCTKTAIYINTARFESRGPIND